MSTLLAHSGAKYQTREQIMALPNGGMPEVPLGPHHKPIPHIELIQNLQTVFAERGLKVKKEQFATMRQDGTFLFGLFDFEPVGGDFSHLDAEGRGLSAGFRSGNAFEKPIEIAIGEHVFVCDNLVLAGDVIILKRRHTIRLDLNEELQRAADRYLVGARELERSIDRFQDFELTDSGAKEVLFDMATGRGAQQVFPVTRLPAIADFYFNAPCLADAEELEARTPDCEPRSLWGVHNAVTRTLRDVKPQPRYECSIKLGRFCDRLTGVVPSEN